MPRSQKFEDRSDIQEDLATRKISAEIYKDLGNDFFRQGKYQEAAAMYNEAVNVFGTQPTYMNNLAATYLKLQDYEMAERAASLALIHDPSLIKARYRRGLARKAMRQFRAARTDFETILREDPNSAEAQVELAAVRRLCENHASDDESSLVIDYVFPAPDHPPKAPIPVWLAPDTPENSDSEGEAEVHDKLHIGNGIPCKHHNLKPDGCAKGTACVYSHAPDARSIADSEGRNVCLYFLLGSCKHGERCLYLHSKVNLPELFRGDLSPREVRDLIRANEEAIHDRRLFTTYMGKGPLGSEELLALKGVLDEAKAKDARKRRKARKLLDLLEDDALQAGPSSSNAFPVHFIMHLTLNKSTTVPQTTLSGLLATVAISRAQTKTKAESFLSSPDLVGVFVTDAGITESRNASLQHKLAAYVRTGGTVVLGGSFKRLVGSKKSFSQMDLSASQLEEYFQKGWGLQWKMGNGGWSCETDLVLNTDSHLALSTASELPHAYCMQGMHLTDVFADDAVYLPQDGFGTRGSTSASLVETPVAFARLGKGYLGFVVDAKAEKATTAVVRAMLRLPSIASYTHQ